MWTINIKGKSYRVGDDRCPYCNEEGPFVQMGPTSVIGKRLERRFLECLVCGNTFIKHVKTLLNFHKRRQPTT